MLIFKKLCQGFLRILNFSIHMDNEILYGGIEDKAHCFYSYYIYLIFRLSKIRGMIRGVFAP